MSSRRQRAAAKGEAQPERQVETHAFNTCGWAIKIPTDKAGVAIVTKIINGYEASTTPWLKAVAQMEKDKINPWRESLSLTPRESDRTEGEAGVQQYLLVGFTIVGLSNEHTSKHPSQKKQMPVGTRINTDGIIEYDTLPIMVVTPIQKSEHTKIDLFVLLRPKLGLCAPFHIGQKECFYLPIFRDNATDMKVRGPAWNQLVAKQALRPSDHESSVRQKVFKRARNTTKVILEPQISLQNEICCLVECFAKTGEMWHLQELDAILRHADEDLEHTPAATNTAVRKFVENDESFEEADAAQMAEELHQLWPELEGIDATDLEIIKQQLIQHNIVLEYRLIRPFIAEACFQIKRVRESHQGGLLDVAQDAIATVRRVLGSCESAVPILTEHDESVLIMAITTTLKKIVESWKTFDKNLKDNCGDQTMTGTLHDVWEKYADALDTDAAKSAWFEAARYLTAAQKHMQRGVAEMVEDVVEVLDEMKLAGEKAEK